MLVPADHLVLKLLLVFARPYLAGIFIGSAHFCKRICSAWANASRRACHRSTLIEPSPAPPSIESQIQR